MRSGRLCSSGGSGWTSTGQLRRSATSATCRAIAPHATTATRRRGSGGEGEAVDEAVVEIGAVGEFDVMHLLQQGLGGGAFPHGQQRHLGALARDVARADDAQG